MVREQNSITEKCAHRCSDDTLNIDTLLMGSLHNIRDKQSQLIEKSVIQIKLLQESFLEILDFLQDSDMEVDKRWLAIGKTDIEKGIMCVLRGIRGR